MKAVCTHCRSEMYTKSKTKGSILMELVLWCLFIVPGLLYSIWRLASRTEACSECGSEHFVKSGSDAAKRLVKA